jgi:hypothetical protein
MTEEMRRRAIITEEMRQRGIIDELCTCGHLRSVHGITTDLGGFGFHPENLDDYEMLGGGSCDLPDCFCPQFTWKSFVYDHEQRQKG